MPISYWWCILTFTLCLCVQKSASQTAKSCPPQELILPCRCLTRGDEIQIWCTHSDLPRVIGGLRTVGKYLFHPIDELILENNNLPSLPGRSFLPLQVMRLMLRYNGLERVSNGWLNGLETSLMELFIVEPQLRSLPEESLEHLEQLEAVTIHSNSIKRLPSFTGLPRLRYIQIESFSLTELSPHHYRNLPMLEKFQLSGSTRLSRLESGLLQDLPNLALVNISYCGISWLHPRAIARLPLLTELSLIGNKISDAGMVGRGIRDLPALETLSLDYNNIGKIEETAFVDLPSLKKLTMSGNQITELHRGAFHRVPSLKMLDLNYNLVKRVHPESFLLHSSSGLEELWLMNNEISHVAELRSLLDALPRLIFLEMSYNNLQAIPFGALRGHPTLERLHLDHNKIHLIDREAFMAMPALRELRLKNNSLSDVLEGPLWNLPALKGLDLSENYFRRIDPRLFENVPSLRRIDLHSNDLVMVDPATFLQTPALEHVNLSRNALATIHPATFRHLLNLFELDVSSNRLLEFVPGLPRGIEYLHMSHNQISAIPMSPSPDLDLPSLKLLDISSNLIQKIPSGTLRSLPMLRKLYMGDNTLQEIDEKTFQGLQKLEILDLKTNRILHIHPRSLKGMSELYELNFRENRIDVLRPEIFEGMNKLKILDVSRNQLTEILPDTLENLRDVHVLDASHNLLVELPSSLYGMKNLRSLDLTDNRLQIIHSETLSSLSSLAELKLSKNNVRSLPTGAFNKLLELKILHLDNNEIENIESNAINSLPLLKNLKLSQNKLQLIPPAAFSDLPSLQVAELQENLLKSVAPNAFHAVPHLLVLNISSNQLMEMEEAGLRSIPSLELLDISNNKLMRVLSPSLEKMEWLVELRLDNNRICAVHGSAFNGMPRLRVLSIRNNKMMSFPENAIEKLRGNIAVFDLEGNPLTCSCSLLWMRAWLQESSILGPRCIDGTLLRDLRLSRQDCLQEDRASEPVVPGCEAELLSAPPNGQRTSQVFSQYMNLKSNNSKHINKNNLAPSPEESDYFYDEYVDYPINDTSIINPMNTITNGNIKEHKTEVIPNKTANNLSSHYISGDTPTLYAAPSKNKTKLQPPKEVHGSPSSSGFTFFGVPLPSLSFNNLWGNGRMSDRKPLMTPIAERKTAIVNKPHGDFDRTAMAPPSHPEIQKGGFVPLLPGAGGFKPIINPIFNKTYNLNFTVDRNKVNIKHSSGSADATNLAPTRLPAVTRPYLKQENFSSMGHPIPAPTESSIKTHERRSTTSTPLSNLGNGDSSKIQTKIEILPPNIPIKASVTKIDASEMNDTKTVNITPVKIIPTKPAPSVTKKPEKLKPSNNPDIEIASDAQSFDEILKEIIENVSLPVTMTKASVLSTSQSTTEKYIKTTPIPQTSSYDEDEMVEPIIVETNEKVEPIKKDATPLSTLLIPGGLQPDYRVNSGAKSSITKIPSPHVSASAPLQADIDLDFTEDLEPMPHNREAKTSMHTESSIHHNDNSAGDRSWYFMNYNKTNLEPYIGPGITKYQNSSNKTREVYEVLIFLCIVIVNMI